VRPAFGKLGIWMRHLEASPQLAREVEQAGYSAIWLGSSPGGDLTRVDDLLAATERLVVATGIVNVWNDDARTIAAAHHRITGRFPGRFLLGVGIGHPESTDRYRSPYEALVQYLDVLDAEGVPSDERALAALGPKVLRLAAERTAGAHPYLVTPEHTRQARELIGPHALLAPEQKVVVDGDPARARAVARPRVARPYLGLSNYLASLRRLGFGEDDFRGDGSDRLIDALVAQGDAPVAATRVAEHYAAGADHVAVQLLSGPGPDRLQGYRALARELV
jgi:probable F420-dependent oxidoreductase